MTGLALARFLALMLPAAVLFVLHVTGAHTARQRSAALFAGLWCGLATLCLGAYDAHTGGLVFSLQGAALYGMPVDLALACGLTMLAGGLLAGASAMRWSVTGLVAAGFAAACFAVFSTADKNAIVLAAAAAAIPAAMLGLFTAQDRHVYARSFLQALVWCALLLWLLPATALTQAAGSWTALRAHPAWMYLPMILPAGLMAHALYLFARHGDGTGFPYDPPKKLVTQGIYAYVSNPMQIAICMAMTWWGVLLQNTVVGFCGPLALLLFIVFKDVCNGSSNLCGQDPGWRAYQSAVPRWWPRRRAYVPPAAHAAPQNNPEKKRA